ncbi:MAG TPA: non-homologous end-joining DNA ligase [Kofleriaceae bacterium]|jgi:bifunctional non-homologous end joining protein LigD
MARSNVDKLAKYRSMRDFTRTAEPSGAAKPGAGNSFVIQKHAASRLHYDFRLELDGVLLSWSVPKGPSLSPKERRLAVRTEDHPLDYAGFEGIIPKGEYGGGSVVVWDRGTWDPEGGLDGARAMLAKGRITFDLHGEKLSGRWHLVRTKPQGKQEGWLLFKGRDAAADDKKDIVEERPESVISGRTVEQVAENPDRVWRSNRPVKLASQPVFKPAANQNELANLVAQLPLGYGLTNLNKVLWADQGLTKGQLVAYLAVVAEHMLPHVEKRPLTLVRCPEGAGKKCFFQKKLLAGSPAQIHPVELEEADGTQVKYMYIDDMPGLVGLAQLGTLEIHTWGSHVDKVERPDVMVFDLDPDVGLPWSTVALAAFAVRRRLADLGLASFVKTTGGKGLHVVVPVERRLSWDDFKLATKLVAEQMVADDPVHFTTNMSKAARKGKIFLDYLRNGRGATFIAPYSPRSRPGAPVAIPISWEELANGIDPSAFTVSTVPARLGKVKDPWRDYASTKQAITLAQLRALKREED